MHLYIFIKTISIFLLTQVVVQVNSARILGIFPSPSSSHYTLGHILMKELASRGHEVTLINSYGKKNEIKNYKNILIPNNFTEQDEFRRKIIISPLEPNPYKATYQILNHCTGMAEIGLKSKSVQDFIKSEQKFDLVVMEVFLNEALVGFAHLYNTPLILLSTIGPNFMINHYTQTPEPTSYCPQMFLGLVGKMNFVERLMNTIFSAYTDLLMNFVHFPTQNVLLQKYFPGSPPIKQIIRECVNTVLLNSHSSFTSAKPIVPNMIEIGGYHVEKPKELPKDLKDYLDNATEGFILFSMGSLVKGNMIPEDKRNIFLKVFEKLPYKILWKFEDDNLPGQPKNVKIKKWLPQNDILAHPNIKLFITHGGMLSTIEAVYHGVPVVGIPVFGDQIVNMKNSKHLGIGEMIGFYSITYNDLLQTINTALHDKKYKDIAMERSRILHDQPMKPLDKAMFWIEYALRNKNADHLKTLAADLKFWEVMNLDVIAVLGSILFISIYIVCWILKKIIFCCCQTTKQIPKLKQSKKKIQ